MIAIDGKSMLQTLRGLISEKLKGNIGTIALCSTLKGR
jgi:hypothetical protein